MSEKYVSRLKKRYLEEIKPQLMKELGITNPMAAPKIEKVVVNMGVGEAIVNKKVLEDAYAVIAVSSA
jgi:large subunit ribosomal protein L5